MHGIMLACDRLVVHAIISMKPVHAPGYHCEFDLPPSTPPPNLLPSVTNAIPLCLVLPWKCTPSYGYGLWFATQLPPIHGQPTSLDSPLCM
jgi:hypothetical protein